MTYEEACAWIALHKPYHWTFDSETTETIAADAAQAKRMSDPATWPENRSEADEK